MTLKRRLNKIEATLKADVKYKGCELEIEVGVDGEPTRYFCRYPDGHREQITDSSIVSELEDSSGDEINVEVID
jgi:hypothetical protein